MEAVLSQRKWQFPWRLSSVFPARGNCEALVVIAPEWLPSPPRFLPAVRLSQAPAQLTHAVTILKHKWTGLSLETSVLKSSPINCVLIAIVGFPGFAH